MEEDIRWVSGTWIGLKDNDSGNEFIEDIPVRNVYEVLGPRGLDLGWEHELKI